MPYTINSPYSTKWGNFVVNSANVIFTPETMISPDGWVPMCARDGASAGAVQLSSLGVTIHPNFSGLICVPAADVPRLRQAGWTEYVFVSTVLNTKGPNPITAGSTLYTAQGGWYPRAQLVKGTLSALLQAPAGTSVAGIAMDLLITETQSVIASGVTDATGAFSLSTATLPVHDPGPVVKTVLTIAAAGAAFTGNAFVSLAIVGTLAKAGLVNCEDVATNAEFFAKSVDQIKAPEPIRQSAAEQLRHFARLVRNGATMSPGAGRA